MQSTIAITTLCAVATILVADPRPSQAWVNAAQLYPYCSVGSSTGAWNCYISSRDQCEFRDVCIENPSYMGAERARAWKHKNKPIWRWW
jgi:hypothetical protein